MQFSSLQTWLPRRTALAVLGAWLSFSPVLGDDLADSLHDCRWTMQVRQSLLQDERLGELNLGVTVRDHVAVLWGPVPSAELARLALERVQRIQGIAAVVNEMYVDPSLPQTPVKPQRKQLDPATKSAIPGGSLMGRPPERRPVLGQGMGWRPVTTAPQETGSATLPPTKNSNPPAIVVPAIVVPSAPRAAQRRPAATLLQPIFSHDSKRSER